MGAFFGLVVRLATGIGLPFSFAAWLAMSVLLLAAGAVVCTVAAPLVEPVAVEIALRPARVARWLVWSLVLWTLVVMGLVITIVGSPLAVIAVCIAVLACGVGYAALGLIIGDRVLRAAGHQRSAWQAVLVGIGVLRVVRLVPVVGGVLHALCVWVALAAASALVWDAVRSWHARRLPDRVQFPNERIIEWHPPDTDQR